jgi:hypothetical protein
MAFNIAALSLIDADFRQLIDIHVAGYPTKIIMALS